MRVLELLLGVIMRELSGVELGCLTGRYIYKGVDIDECLVAF
jgi:hypothetical protein